jgi:membrane protease YdiL (CAAX protease family)
VGRAARALALAGRAALDRLALVGLVLVALVGLVAFVGFVLVALFVLVAVIMAPFFEEMFFRGFIFGGLSQSFGWAWGAAGSAAIFGLAHLQLTVFVPLFSLGFGLAWVYKRTGSLWTCIALHALFNAISVLVWALTG